MRKVYASVTYLFTYDIEDLNLPEDCTDLEMEEKANEFVDEFVQTVHLQTFIVPNDIELEVCI